MYVYIYIRVPRECAFKVDGTFQRTYYVISDEAVWQFDKPDDEWPSRSFGYYQANVSKVSEANANMTTGLVMEVQGHELRFSMNSESEYDVLMAKLKALAEKAQLVHDAEQQKLQSDIDEYYITIAKSSSNIINQTVLPAMSFADLMQHNSVSKILVLCCQDYYGSLRYVCSRVLSLLLKCGISNSYEPWKQLLAMKPINSTDIVLPPRIHKGKPKKQTVTSKIDNGKLTQQFDFPVSIPEDSKSKITMINGTAEYPFDVNVVIPIMEFLKRTTVNTRFAISNSTAGDIPVISTSLHTNLILKSNDMTCILTSGDYENVLIDNEKQKVDIPPQVYHHPPEEPYETHRLEEYIKDFSLAQHTPVQSPNRGSVPAAPAAVAPMKPLPPAATTKKEESSTKLSTNTPSRPSANSSSSSTATPEKPKASKLQQPSKGPVKTIVMKGSVKTAHSDSTNSKKSSTLPPTKTGLTKSRTSSKNQDDIKKTAPPSGKDQKRQSQKLPAVQTASPAAAFKKRASQQIPSGLVPPNQPPAGEKKTPQTIKRTSSKLKKPVATSK